MITGQRHDLAEVKRAYPLPEVLEASGIALRRGGPGIFGARCPFHADTRPSFFVDVRSAEDPHFHCFGSRVHGDVVDFVRLRDGVPGHANVHAGGRMNVIGGGQRWPSPVASWKSPPS
jgi:DNA primase